MFRMSVVGHLCVDLVPSLPSSARFAPGQLIQIGPMDVRLGGAVPNTGLALRDLGAEVSLHAVVGDDPLGAVAERLLGDRAQIRRIAGGSTSYSIVLEPQGADRTFWHHTGTNTLFDPALISVDTDLIHLGYPPLLPSTLVEDAEPLRTLFARARAAGATTSLDLAVVDPASEIGRLDWPTILGHLLPHTDVISPSVDDLTSMLGTDQQPSLELANALATRLINLGAAIAMVTAGSQGLVLRTATADRLARGGRVLTELSPEWADARVILPAIPSTGHVTSAGAGDAATAGLLHALTLGLMPTAAVELARSTSGAVMAGRRPVRTCAPA